MNLMALAVNPPHYIQPHDWRITTVVASLVTRSTFSPAMQRNSCCAATPRWSSNPANATAAGAFVAPIAASSSPLNASSYCSPSANPAWRPLALNRTFNSLGAASIEYCKIKIGLGHQLRGCSDEPVFNTVLQKRSCHHSIPQCCHPVASQLILHQPPTHGP